MVANLESQALLNHGVQRRMISVDNFFVFLKLLFFALLLLYDIVHDVETIFHLSYVLTASGNLFQMLLICSFTGITHISEKISRCC